MLENLILFIIFIGSKYVIIIHFPAVIIDYRSGEKILHFPVIIVT